MKVNKQLTVNEVEILESLGFETEMANVYFKKSGNFELIVNPNGEKGVLTICYSKNIEVGILNDICRKQHDDFDSLVEIEIDDSTGGMEFCEIIRVLIEKGVVKQV